jgi:hypothetical protein
MTRSIHLALTLLILPVVTIGCGDSESDGYHEITASVESLPTTAEVDGDQDYLPIGTAAVNTETTPDTTAKTEPASTPDDSKDAVAAEGTGDSGTADPQSEKPAATSDEATTVAENSADPEATTDDPASPRQPSEEMPKREIKLLIPSKTFKAEGTEKALRVSFDDVDLLKVLNMDPVIPEAPKMMPDWLRQLDGKRVRIRGFMIPPFSETDVRAFTLARDTQLCCFGRNPLPYDLIDVFLKEGAATEYIELRPFDVVGVFHIGEEIEPGYLYSIDDAVVIQ